MAESLSSIWLRRKEEAKKRLEICGKCDRYNATTTQCKECGCFMIAKSLLPYSECPLKKWGSFTETDETQNK